MTSAGKNAHVLLGGFALGLKQKLALLGLLALAVAAGYSGVAHAQSPVAAYSFDEGSGETAKDSAGDHDGTIEGASWVSSGKYGSALEFDGENDLVSITDAVDLDLTGPFTLEAWVRPDTFSAARPVISKVGFPEAGVGGYQLEGTSTGMPLGRVASSGAVKGVEGVEALPTEEVWSHLAFTSDSSTLRLYVNGVLAKSGEGLTAADTSATIKIGKGVGGWFDGLIDEVRVYDEELTEAQIASDKDTRVEHPAPTEATTTSLDTGPNSEQVATLAITDPQDPDLESVVYSLPVPSITAGEVLRATANLELTNDQSYQTTDSVKLVLGSSATDTNGEVVVPWSSVIHTPEMRHWTFPISGIYHATSNLGIQYLKVVAKAQSPSAGTSDTLTVQQNFGRLEAARSTPSIGPMSQPTHKIQPQIDPLTQLETSLPVNSSWHRVLTRSVGDLTVDDILDIASQIEIRNSSSATVEVQSKVSMTTTPSLGAYPTAAPPITEQLSDDMPTARMVHASKIKVADPANRYFNLLVKASPVSGTPAPLDIAANTSTLDVLRYEDSSGDPDEPIGTGTWIEQRAGFKTPGLTEIPYAVGGGSEKRVVASTALYDGIWKGAIINARGLFTGDMNGTSEVTQVLTRLILADSPTDTEGETIGIFSGDKVPPSAQIHTSVKEGSYVMPAALPVVKYVNFVVYASQANPSGSMIVDDASIYLTRSRRTTALNEAFEDGLDTDGVDSVFEEEFNGLASVSSAVAREGSKSLEISVDRTPIAAYSFNEGQGTTVDDIYGNHDGEVSGAAWESSGKYGSALSFDGVDDFVTVAEPDELDLTAPFSLSAWVNPETLDASSPIIAKAENAGSGGSGYLLTARYLGAPSGWVADSGASQGVTSGGLTTKRWTHVAFTSDGSTLQFYLDGSLAATNSNAIDAAATGADLLIGHDEMFGGYFDGLIDEVRIYDEELSEEEIEADMLNYSLGQANIRRTEVRPPNIRTAAGYYGEDNWHGFSVYFPEEFDAPGPDPIVYFHGLIDEVRLHDQALSESQIADEMAGEYGQNPTPAAAYDFDDGAGNTATDSAGSNDGTISGATWDTNGKFGSALKFDGIGDEVTIPDAEELDLTGSFTLEAWVRPDAVSAWTGTPVIDKLDNPTGSKSGYLLRAAASGSEPTGLVSSSGSVANAYGASALPLNEWTHLALVSTASEVTLYVDGQPTQTSSAFKVPATSSDLTIGSSRFNTATRGTWNIFSQFHGTTLGKQELGCPENPNGVPIAFNARHYQANDYTNPGESETATPVEGDYIEIAFQGGEISADCSSAVNPIFRYVVAPLETDRWYDFVVHTTWTHLKGSEGNSVSEVWMNRNEPGTLEQVLGNGTVPVIQPTLSWRLTPDMHTTDAFRHMGLYRGGSLEDPQVELYLDAIRSGNSCAEVAPGQPAGEPCSG